MQFLSASLAGGLLLLSVRAANVTPAITTVDLDVNAGPSSEDRVADTMQRRTAVDAPDCGAPSCRIALHYGATYASRSDLDLGDPVSAGALPSSFVPLPLLFAWHHGWSGRYWHHHWYQRH